MLGAVVRAEDSVTTTSTAETTSVQDKKIEREKERVNKENEFKNKVKEIRSELKTTKEEFKNKLDEMVQSVKQKREEFKTELDANKEISKTKVEEARTLFKENINKIKDEAKKTSAEKVFSTIADLNTKLTGQLSSKIDQIENVLISIDSRISKAEAKGIDVTSVKAQSVKAHESITLARTAIVDQSKKIYTTTVSSDTTLRANMKTLRDNFNKDMKALNIVVKATHTAVKTTATTLAQIPNIDAVETSTTTTQTNN